MIQIKNAKELDGMRKANALSAAALKYGGEHIEAGMTTWELDKLIYDFIVKHGGTPNFKGLYGFPGTACISLNDTIIHGIPSHDIVIRPGDIVSIDTGAKIDGFSTVAALYMEQVQIVTLDPSIKTVADTDLPARSATVLMEALVVTICTCSMYRAATVEKPSTLVSNRLVPL